MYEELIERLKAIICDENLDLDTAVILEQAANAIEEQDMCYRHLERDHKDLCAYLPRWIPMSKRLPDVCEDVLLLFPHNQAAGFYNGDDWCIYSGDAWYTPVLEEDNKPTHWAKRLPEPPKEST